MSHRLISSSPMPRMEKNRSEKLFQFSCDWRKIFGNWSRHNLDNLRKIGFESTSLLPNRFCCRWKRRRCGADKDFLEKNEKLSPTFFFLVLGIEREIWIMWWEKCPSNFSLSSFNQTNPLLSSSVECETEREISRCSHISSTSWLCHRLLNSESARLLVFLLSWNMSEGEKSVKKCRRVMKSSICLWYISKCPSLLPPFSWGSLNINRRHASRAREDEWENDL